MHGGRVHFTQVHITYGTPNLNKTGNGTILCHDLRCSNSCYCMQNLKELREKLKELREHLPQSLSAAKINIFQVQTFFFDNLI